MRKLTVAAACLSLALAAGGYAKAEELTPLPRAPSAQNASPIRSVTVLDIGSLPPEVRAQINAVVSQAGPDDLRQLREAIDSTPMAAVALKTKGMSSAEIVAAAIDDEGDLTLIARELI